MSAGSPSRPGVASLLAGWLSSNQSILFPIAVLGSLVIFVVPLPTFAMDFLLSANISLAILILLATINLKNPMEFNAFPTVLLATTLFRLVLNVATTRLIFLNAADEGAFAAGAVVEAFGNFVAGGNLALGIVIFSILAIIQFVVINKGSVRVAEVAARFALDGMPGKQMAIDADLNAGMIDEQQAKQRREEVGAQADFYGSMDGASKFVRGDAVAGIIITGVNIIGGLAYGVLSEGMDLRTAAEVFTRLTIGDGLVSQFPALLLSVAAGMLVTRQSKSSDLSAQLSKQVFQTNPRSLYIAGGFIALLAMTGFITGLPVIPFAMISIACLYGGRVMENKAKKKIEQEVEMEKKAAVPAARRPTERVEDALKLDALELEVGYSLIRLADKKKGGDIEDRIVLIRKQLANELGMILPGVRLRDNPNLDPNEYVIKLKGNPVARAKAYPGHFLAIDTGMTSGELRGIKTTEPLFGQTAYWIDPSQRERAEMLGFSVIEASHVVTTHLTETIRKHAADLLNRERVATLVAVVKESAPQVVDEVIPNVMKLGDIQRVLQNLLRENVSIRDMESILETLGDYGTKTKDADILTEYVRHRLSRSICEHYRNVDGVIKVVTLDPRLEDMIAAGVEHTDRLTVKLSPAVIEGIGRSIAEEVRKLVQQNLPSIVLVGPQIRAALKQLTSQMIPSLVVLSYNEITRETRVEAVGMAQFQPKPVGVGAGS